LFIDDLFEGCTGEPRADPSAVIADVPIAFTAEGSFTHSRGVADDLGLAMGTGNRRGLKERPA